MRMNRSLSKRRLADLANLQGGSGPAAGRRAHGLRMALALGMIGALAGCSQPTPAQLKAWQSETNSGPVTASQTDSAQGGYAGQNKPLQGSFGN